MTDDALRYGSAGVDIDGSNAAKNRIKKLVESTFTPGVLAGFGGFGGMFRVPAGLEKPILVSSADGVGTKIKVAIEANRHDTIGRDLVNHCVNDILVQGALPLFFLDYVAFGTLDPAIVEAVVAGVAAGCRENGCALIGGETAEMPGLYTPPDYDLAGFIVGYVEENRILGPHRVRPDDVLVGLPSSGLHTNGYSLARKVLVESAGRDYQSILPGIGKIGEALLQPHISYLKPLISLIEAGRIHALAHITGGGLTDNVPRVLPEKLDAHIKLGSWDVLPIFRLIHQEGKIDRDEMLRVFNMGIGMVIILSKGEVDAVVRHFAQIGQRYYFVGNVVRGSGRVVYDTPPAGFPSWIE